MNFDPSTWKSQKFSFSMCSFWAKYILFELKKYRGITFHETEERCKIWRGINLSFQNWHKEFDKIWPEHLKVSKMFILLGSVWAKYVLFELEKYRGIIFYEIEEGYKIFRGIDFSFQNWHKELDKIWLEHLKVSKMFILLGFFRAKYVLFELKKYRGIIFLKLKRNTIFVEESTCRFKIGIRNLTNFDPSTQKFQKFSV